MRAERITALQTSSSVRLYLIGTINGDVEAEMHRRFASAKRHGEWFEASRENREFLFTQFDYSLFCFQDERRKAPRTEYERVESMLPEPQEDRRFSPCVQTFDCHIGRDVRHRRILIRDQLYDQAEVMVERRRKHK